ncbi:MULTISPECIES: Gfo/Idh/MocA family protein [unclassified Fusibacter]|uniref:Gfo/Idh/MocA family protein n=1 Tax=unclassified Fusibacter TaxID=2624464 RepID=UPI00101138D8|nr:MULTISPECIES: Gfo/Idh/MocA family oxidoreductase [unclassified Fusibacter]MCK8059241.1 Gfo/Idh/MocA family oxidoreductase [Fusibacter sp. A2]NPE21295.1 Gfo/Idh/MocA family oxidoreductase [Fusibacter sp. A1]RXV62559.1 gfo/Idh/MocA family oxidoreductase [Fusibacter sp. A1]
MKKIRVGIIGCGGIANNKHMPVLKKLDQVEMVAFCDIDLTKAKQAVKDFGIKGAKAYQDFNELLKDESIDTIHVCTPNKSHMEISVAAMVAGKHVMCEKPMAKTAKDARLMLEASKKTGKLLTIGYQNRYRADSQYLHKAVKRGDLGEVYFAKAHAIRRRAVPTWGVFLNEEEQGGGPLIDIGTHALDLTLWAMDNYKVKSVKGSVYKKLGDQTQTGNAWGDWDTQAFTVEDSAFGFITMENGATIMLEASWALNTLDVKEARTTLCGTKAGADMEDGLRINSTDFGKLTTLKPSLGAEGVDFYEGGEDKPEVLEAKAFYRAVIEDEPLVVEAEQALVVTEILEAIYESARTGKEIEF